MLENLISNINNMLWGYPLILILVSISIYLSFKFKFPQLKIVLAIKSIFKSNERRGKITSFRALMTILAGTLGTGNITGVAAAIALGGVGSLFWMFVSAIFAMIISYVENYIVLRHRHWDKKKGFFGGPMYVLDEILDKRKLAVIFAIAVIFSAAFSGTMTQSNSLSLILNTTFSVNKKVVGIILAIITTYIVFGGKTRIAKASSIVIPICSIAYVVLCLAIICINKTNVLDAFYKIVTSAFGSKQIVGGIVGASLSRAIGKGFAIGMFSNEAGMGSATIFAATVEEEDIKLQSKIVANSVVIDTMLLCMLTGITIVSTGCYNIPDASLMLEKVFGIVPYGNVILNICMVFFVISTIPCWEYYGEEAVKYLFKNNGYIYIFRIIYVIGIYLGSIMELNMVWDLAGISNALMALPNLYMICSYVRANTFTNS